MDVPVRFRVMLGSAGVALLWFLGIDGVGASDLRPPISDARLASGGGQTRLSSTQSGPGKSGVTAGPDPTLVGKFCISCHNQRLQTAGLALDTLDIDRVEERPDVWEKVARKLRAGAMPPPAAQRPDPAAMKTFVESLEASLERAAIAHPNPGRNAVHRLNRAEYANAIRDLLSARYRRPVDPPRRRCRSAWF